MIIDPVKTLKDLVKINTTNPPGAEACLMSYLETILDEAKIPFVHQESAPGRGNLLAWLPASGEAKKPPLALLSHMDVVAAQAEQWLYPPFEAREVDGYIYGRGTVDTKQLTVMELFAFLSLQESGAALDRDVYFLATGDEECGSNLGLKWFLSHEITANGRTVTGQELLRNADVISEGGGFPIVVGEKEFYLCESGQKSCGSVQFKVKARHAKGPFFGSGDGMERAMALVGDIGSLELAGKQLDTVKRFEQKLAGAKLSPMMEKILLAMQKNTMTVTMITGTNVNEVTVTCDVRLLPGFGRDYLTTVLDELARKWDCSYEILALGQGYESSPESAFMEILEKATLSVLGKTKEQTELLPFVSMGSSDGHLLVDSGARVYGYSPVYSWDMTFDTAVTMVHGVNERIHKDSVVFGSKVLALAVKQAAGKEESSND